MSICLTLPLTEAQKGLWLGQQKLANSPLYNTAEIVRFEGEINREKLVAAICQVIQYTAALNMYFTHGSNGLVQHYRSNNANIGGPVNDLTNVQIEADNINKFPPTSEAQLNQYFYFSDTKSMLDWQHYWLAQVMDLTQDRPFRHALIQNPNGDYAWYLQIHHIACDGFSYALISKALKAAYEGTLATSELNAIKSYEALINQTISYDTSDQKDNDEVYWRNQLKTHHPLSFKPVELAESQPCVARRVAIKLNSDFYAELKHQAGALNNDWPTLLKAIVAKWLHACTGKTAITFGCPDMNRPFGPTMGTPALQMNIVPLTVVIKATETIVELARKIQQQKKADKKHVNYRYELLPTLLKQIHKHKVLNEITDSGTMRAFGPIINILPFDRSLQLGHVKARIESLSAGPVEDIAIYFAINDCNGLDSFIELHPDLYSKEESQWLCDNLSRWLNDTALFDSIAPTQNGTPAKASSHVNGHYIKSNGEFDYSSIIGGSVFNDALGINTCTTRKNVFELIDLQRQTQGQREALRWLDESQPEAEWQSINYHTLCTYVADTAQTFAQAGLRKGQKCLIATGRSPWSIASMLASLALNAEFIGIDIDGPDSRLQTIIDDSSPSLVVVNDADWLEQKSLQLPNQSKLITVARIAHFAYNSKVTTARAMAVFCQQQDPTAAVYSIYTSGTTGAPKAVQISQKSLLHFIYSANTVYQIGPQDQVLQFSPLHFDACIEEIFISLCQGATLTLRSSKMVENFNTFNRTVESLGITVLDLPTAFWHEWVRFTAHSQGSFPSRVSRVIIGGEACKPSAIDEFFAVPHHACLINTYGPSEATVIATTKTITRENRHNLHCASIGNPLPGRRVYILDQNNQLIPKGLTGQLVLAGDSLAEGYFGQPTLTSSKFITLNNQERVYLTGDRAAISPSNEVIFHGRVDDEIKISGQRIHPAEIVAAIEAVLSDYQIAVISREHNRQPQIFAVVARECHGQFSRYPDTPKLKQALAKTLPEVQIPGQIFVCNKLPLTRSGKVDRNKLWNEIKAQDSHATNLADDADTNSHQTRSSDVSNNELRAVLTIWKDVLGINNIIADDDFFVLGGTSLQLLQVATRLNEYVFSLNKHNLNEISVSDLFQNPKASDLAKTLKAPNDQIKGETQPTLAFSAPQLTKELQLKFRQSRKHKHPEHLLLTGSTGFIGIHIVSALIEKGCRVSCVIRADNEQQARKKLAIACQSQGLSDISQTQSIAVVLGDLSVPDWGLSERHLASLAEPLTGVIHNGAMTSVVRDYQSLAAVNVNATATALKLAHLAGVAFHYISTVAITDNKTLPETFIEAHNYLQDGYQQSKWAAENLIQQRAKLNQPYGIYRLPRVVGDPNTGAINPKDLIWQIAAASERAQLLPLLAFEEPWLAVNEVARFVSERVVQQHLGIYNCMPNQPVAIKELLNKIAEACHLPQVPIDEWLIALQASQHSEDRALHAFFSQMSNAQGAQLPTIKRDAFLAKAKSSALQPLSFDAYLRNAFERNILRPKQTILPSDYRHTPSHNGPSKTSDPTPSQEIA